MTLFLTLLTKILPLYGMIALGYIGGKYLSVSRTDIATVVIYLFVPVVFFGAVATTPLTPQYLALPFIAFLMSAVMAFSVFYIAGKIYQDSQKNLIGMAACTGNTGYFGMPIFLALYPETHVGVYLLAILGITIAESTIGYYLLARGNFTVRDSLIKLAKMPTIYAVTAGLLFNLSGFTMPEIVMETHAKFRGGYIILGMMMIGLGLSGIKHFTFGKRFLSLLLIQKFIGWPLLAFAIIAVDRHTVQLFDDLARTCILIFSTVPLAANTVAFATTLNIHPEKAAAAVMLSTLVALAYIPLFYAIAL